VITFIHNNPIVIRDGTLTVDRKFHTGMLDYGTHIRSQLLTVHPLVADTKGFMDPVELQLGALPYKVLGLNMTPSYEPETASTHALALAVQESRVVVGWGYGGPQLAAKFRKRYIACLEYDLQTQLLAATSFIGNPVRKFHAALKITRSYYRDMVPAMRYAYEVHCNGYPMHKVAQAYNARSLLYLDSRMNSSLVIPEGNLQSRLDSLGKRRLRLVFSGRFEKMKGALDAVLAARRCLDRGADLEMHCYGSGSLGGRMKEEAARSAGRITIHDPVTFEELVQRARAADLFICCHIQSDPSCTYVESMGAGLPIVGYGNRMWTALAKESGAGVVASNRSPDAVATAIMELQNDRRTLIEMSHRARDFAVEHSFEREFRRRTDAINAALCT
jgi:colanic acid/amylovoran biosynthesis glycosyltransferase